MTVLYAGTELMDFSTIGGTVTTVTSAGYFNASNSRCAVSPSPNSVDNTHYVDAAFTITSEIWAHVYYRSATNIGSTTVPLFKIYSGGTQRIGVFLSTGGIITVSTWNGSAWTVVLTSATVMSANSQYTIDMHIKVGNPGTFVLYIDGGPVVASVALDLSFGSITGFDALRIQSANINFNGGFSEIIVADFNTINSKIVSRAPSGNGNYTAWTGVYTDIDDISGGTDNILSGSVGDRESWTIAAFPALGTGESIVAVGIGASALRDAAGPQSLNFFTRISATDYDKADETVNVASTNLHKLWELSPATSAAWTVAEVNAAEFGVRART